MKANDDIILEYKGNCFSDVQLMNLRDRGDVVAPLMFPLKETHKSLSIWRV